MIALNSYEDARMLQAIGATRMNVDAINLISVTYICMEGGLPTCRL